MRRRKAGDIFLRAGTVALVEHDDLRERGELFGVRRELGVDLVKVLQRIAPLGACNVQNVADHAGALDMAQKPVAQSRALRRALDEPGDIRRDKGIFIVLHDA